MTPKKEKCGLGAAAPKNPAQECTSLYILELRVFLHTQKLVRFVLGGRPVRLWGYSVFRIDESQSVGHADIKNIRNVISFSVFYEIVDWL